MTAVKMLESYRQYICTKCKYAVLARGEFDRANVITPPKKCVNPEGCGSTSLITTQDLNPDYCKDYQEIKLQEIVSKLEVGNIPNSMWVVLDDDLVDSCKPGDSITVCGIVKQRWNKFSLGQRMEIELVIKAIHVQINNCNGVALAALVNAEATAMFRGFWESYSDNPLAARDMILKSICPQLFGLHLVKLAVAIILAGGSQTEDTTTGIKLRSEPHLLLVGDPGTGKSQLLRFASKLVPRSMLTTGIGSTAAGLTAAAIMENGEWQLEGGALVLSDGGICCIDEFNSMKEHDRISIHEAMEQQTISIAKASIVCKLNTRCSILAATNPKGNLDSSQPLNMNVGFASPLLSRFDLIMLLRDKVNTEVDSLLADYILNRQNNTHDVTTNISWTIETLQSYFAIIKKIHPTLSEHSSRILSGYYQAQRQKNYRNKSRTTVRLLDSLIRLSQGHARLMYHTQVEVVDSVMAITLVETAMEEEFSFFGLQFDVQNDFPSSPVEYYKTLINIVLKKLRLDDILDEEIASVDRRSKSKAIIVHSDNPENIIINESKESRFFETRTRTLKDEMKIVKVKTTDSILKNQKRHTNQLDQGTRSPHQVKKRIQSISDCQNNIDDDLHALNCVPSINDCFEADYACLEGIEKKIDSTNNTNSVESDVGTTKNKNFDEGIIRKRLDKFRYKPREPTDPTTTNESKSKTIFADDEVDQLNLSLDD